jgi:DNA-binding MarR family transcriptional regulator
MSENQSLDSETAKMTELMELLFFAYRDFISDPDEILAKYGFGRAHHRVVHFVGRHPGIRVAELLDILRITKQSLGRVLKELIDTGYVLQQEGETDRRRRLLFLTDSGCALHRELMSPQLARFRRALEKTGSKPEGLHRDVLFQLIDGDDQTHVAALLEQAVSRCEPGKKN